MKPAKLITLLALVLAAPAFGQGKTLDSLRNALATYTRRDTVRVNLLNKTASRIFSTETDKALVMLKESGSLAGDLNYKRGQAFSYLFSGNALLLKSEFQRAFSSFSDALALYEGLRDKEGMANCLFNFGRYYFYVHDFDKSQAYYEKAIALCEETGDTKRLSASLMGIGVIHAKLGNYDKGVAVYNRALQLDQKSGNKNGVANALVNLANIYRKQAKFALALDHYTNALYTKEQLGDQPGIAICMQSIGLVYERLGNNKDAAQYFEKALAIFEKLKYKKELQITLTNLGIAYMNEHIDDRAMKCFQRALELSRELHDNFEIAGCLSNIGNLYLVQKDYTPALNTLKEATTMHEKLGAKNELAFDYLKTGRVYHALRDYDQALVFADKCARIADELGLLEYQRDVLKLRSDVYYATKEYKLAYETSAAHKVLNDSIFKKENIESVSAVKYKYEYKDSLQSAHTKANTLTKTVKVKDAQLESSRRQTTWWIIGSGCLLVVLGLVLALLKIRKIKMENKQLLTEQKLLRSQMNPHFIFNSLQNIRSLIFNRREEEAVQYINKFSGLTRQILESSNENYISLEEEISIIKNYVAIQQLLYSTPFESVLTIDEDLETDSIFIPPMLTQPFIENAIKHGLAGRPEGGLISIRFFLEESRLYFEVSDNGSGFGSQKKQEGHKSMAMEITRGRLAHYTKNRDYAIEAGNITDGGEKILGAKVVFEIPYLYEN